MEEREQSLHAPQGVTDRNYSLVLEMLDAAQALEGAIDHDGQSSAQCFTLLHTVRSQDNTSAFLDDASQYVPKVASGCGVHAGSGLIQQNDRRISHKSYSCAQFTLVPTTAAGKK